MKGKRMRLAALGLVLCVLAAVPARAAGQGVTPGETREEPGHWEKTDVRYFGPSQETVSADGLTVTAGWGEAHEMVYTFAVEDGSKENTFTISGYWLGDSYYASSAVQPGVNLLREAEEPGEVICSLCVGDIAPGEGTYGVKVTPRSYFHTSRGEEAQRFTVGEFMEESSGSDGKKYYFTPSGNLPVGEAEGETICIVLGVMDGSGQARMYTAWEYRWVAQPETVVVPDSYGPIEYGPEDTLLGAAKLGAVILIPAAVIVLGAVLLVRRGRRKK